MTVEDSPENLMRRFADCWNRGDAVELVALFVDDADFVNVVGLWWRKRKDIERAHAYAFARYFKNAKITFDEIKLRSLRETIAIVHGKWLMTGQENPDHSPGAQREGVLVLVAELTNNGWRAVACQNTDVAPGAETNMIEGGKLKPVSY